MADGTSSARWQPACPPTGEVLHDSRISAEVCEFLQDIFFDRKPGGGNEDYNSVRDVMKFTWSNQSETRTFDQLVSLVAFKSLLTSGQSQKVSEFRCHAVTLVTSMSGERTTRVTKKRKVAAAAAIANQGMRCSNREVLRETLA